MAKKDFDKMQIAAGLRLLGGTQAAVAKAVNINERTMRRWETDNNWPDILKAARTDYVKSLAGKVRQRLLDALDDPAHSAATARFLAARILPELQDGGGEKKERPYEWWDMGNGHIAEFY